MDHNPENNDLDNLAWLCLQHHDRYDGKTSQSKGLRASEVKQYRKELYARVGVGLSSAIQSVRSEIEENRDEILPNVGSLRPEITDLTLHPQTGTLRKFKFSADGTDVFKAVLLPFSNDPQRNEQTKPVQDLKARITYYKRDEIDEFKRLDAACWLGQLYPYITLEVGGIVYIVVALVIGGHGAVVESSSPSIIHYGEHKISIDELPTGTYEVKVYLMAGEHGEYSADFWFELEVGGHLKCKRIMPR